MSLLPFHSVLARRVRPAAAHDSLSGRWCARDGTAARHGIGTWGLRVTPRDTYDAGQRGPGHRSPRVDWPERHALLERASSAAATIAVHHCRRRARDGAASMLAHATRETLKSPPLRLQLLISASTSATVDAAFRERQRVRFGLPPLTEAGLHAVAINVLRRRLARAARVSSSTACRPATCAQRGRRRQCDQNTLAGIAVQRTRRTPARVSALGCTQAPRSG